MNKLYFIFFLLAFQWGHSQNTATNQWFKSEKIADGVYKIQDGNISNSYLVIGKKKALLIDPGTGFGDICRVVKEITKLPMEVILTHSHPDHSGGINQFPSFYIHKNDTTMLNYFQKPEIKKEFYKNLGLIRIPKDERIDSVNFVEKPKTKLIPKTSKIKLGGRTITVIFTSGHTAGSISLIDSKTKILFSGDNLGSEIWLHPADAQGIEVYEASLKTLISNQGKFNQLFPGHGQSLPLAIISELLVCAEKIQEKSIKGEKYESFAGNGVIYRVKTCGIVCKE
jgi:hydroxyacylglutathione hydrolase